VGLADSLYRAAERLSLHCYCCISYSMFDDGFLVIQILVEIFQIIMLGRLDVTITLHLQISSETSYMYSLSLILPLKYRNVPMK
jgi:hypothetical protein